MTNAIVVSMTGKDNLSSVADGAQVNVSKSLKKMGDDTTSLSSKLDQLEKDVASTSREIDSAAKSSGGMSRGFDGVRDSADNSERRITGFRDSLTGTQDVMKGLKDGDLVALSTGFADLASSVANLGADMLEWGKKAFEAGKDVVAAHAASVIEKGKDVAATVAHSVATTASTVATQAQTAAQWLLNAAMDANPILLVVVALVALVAIFVVAWKNSETFRDIVTGAFEAVKGAASATFNWVKDNWPLLLAILTGPFGLAVLAIVKNWDEITGFFSGLPGKIGDFLSGIEETITAPFRAGFEAIAALWNDTIGSLSFEAPGWIPGIGGKGWHAPRIGNYDKGGMVPGPAGMAQFAIVHGGERILTPEQQAGAGGTVVYLVVNVAGSVIAQRQLIGEINEALRSGLVIGG